MASKIEKYGAQWDSGLDPLAIELACIRKGGEWTFKGQKRGAGLFEHFMNARALLWSDRYRHRWTDLIYSEIIRNMVTILMGCGSSQKTSHAAEYALIDYWANPDETLVLISTTTVDKLDLAIFGEIKMLFNSAQARYPWLAGNPIESKRAISTDNLEYMDTRDIRKGFVGRACYVGKQYVGLGVFAGIKQKRIRFIADELQFMAPTFFDCLPNMFQSAGLDVNGDPDVKVIGSGNPKHDPYDQLSIAAEPIDGWDSVAGDPQKPKTQCWNTKFHRGRCVNLIGTDSPNFDVGEGERPPFPRLISRNSIRPVEARWGKDSLQYYTQCVGKMMMNMQGNRVLTVQLCENHRAFETAFWKGNDQTRIAFVDPAWGGGDRCIFGWLEFGTALDGMEVIRFGEYMEVPIIANKKVDPDDQIAQFSQMQCTRLVIPGSNLFYGSTGRGTTGAAFARVFGTDAPVPIAEGDRPTPRPVRWDLYVKDPITGQKRHKRCDEEYGRLNAELWFSVRNVVECDQFREMPREVVREFSLREYLPNRSGKIELESKKDTKERMGVSPDLADATSFGVEGARQRGFQIGRLDYQIIEDDEEDFFSEEATEFQQAIQSRLLSHRI